MSSSTPSLLVASAPIATVPQFKMEEIKTHVKGSGSIWIVIDGVVYDVTKFIDQHPGNNSFNNYSFTC